LSTHAAAITGSGADVPSEVIDNEELCASFNAYVRAENDRRAADIAAGRSEALKESSPEFIYSVSGIRRRHVWDKQGILDPKRMCPNIPDRADDELSVQAELGLGAAKKALAAAGREGTEVDLVIVGASAIQRPYPAIAIELADAIGARGRLAYDLSVGCSSAGFAIQLASDAIRAGTASCALVCAPEVPSAYANYRDRDSHFILGDAAAAVVVERLDRAKPGAFEIVSSWCETHYSSNVRNNVGFLGRCAPETMGSADKLFYQRGRRVFKDIVQLIPATLSERLAKSGIPLEAVRRFWLHQANLQMNTSIMTRLLGRAPTSEEMPQFLDEYANTAAAGALFAFDRSHEDLDTGALGVLCAFGAGYSASAQVLRRI
jgi:beta-ketodecanoyl-[acyl-carrier-protein] synthase